MQDRVPWLDYLSNHVGLKEVPGAQHNPLIVEWGKQSGIGWWNNDEDAWCAVAINGALVNSGYPSTRSALARSFTRYGTRLTKPVRGAIVVFPRGSNPLYGHVGIVETVRADGTIVIINGNAGNAVRRSVFSTASILPDGIRWPPGAAAPAQSRPVGADAPLGARVLQFGSRGKDVEALQRDMNVLNYQLAVDGVFGGRTRDAVVRFEQRRGLKGDGITDPAMLAALTEAVAARKARNERRKTAERAAGPIAGAGAAVTVGAAATSAADAAAGFGGLDGSTMLGMAFVGVVVAVVAGILLWRFSIRRAERPMVEDVA